MAEILRQDHVIEPMRAAVVALEICEQLAKFHSWQSTVVHGDIKPSNILLGANDTVRLLDFGIAKMLRADGSATAHNFGSPSYCSPERLTHSEVDRQSDLWAVGATLYEMLSGMPPYQAGDTRRLESLIRSKRPPRALPPSCPRALQLIAMKALAPDAKRRYLTAGEFQADLQAFLEGKPTGAERERQGWNPNATIEAAREALRKATRTVKQANQRWRFLGAAGWFAAGMALWIGGAVGWQQLQARNAALTRLDAAKVSAEWRRIYLDEANTALQASDWQKAEICLQRAVQLGSGDDLTLGRLALVRGYIELEPAGWRRELRSRRGAMEQRRARPFRGGRPAHASRAGAASGAGADLRVLAAQRGTRDGGVSHGGTVGRANRAAGDRTAGRCLSHGGAARSPQCAADGLAGCRDGAADLSAGARVRSRGAVAQGTGGGEGAAAASSRRAKAGTQEAHMAVTRSWTAKPFVVSVANQAPPKSELVWLAAASLFVAAALGMVYSAKVQGFASTTALVNVNTVGSAEELAPLFALYPDRTQREDLARETFEFLERARPLRNVGALTALHAPGTRRPLLPLARLKPLMTVRTPREFQRTFLLWAGLYFGGFYLAALVWKAARFAGDRSFLPALQLLTGIGLALMISMRDPLRDTLEFHKFALGVFLGCLLLILPALSLFDYRRLSDWCYTPLFGALGLFGALLVFGKGPAGNDAKVNLGPFQPVELIKILLVLFLAGYFTRNWERLRDLRNRVGHACACSTCCRCCALRAFPWCSSSC